MDLIRYAQEAQRRYLIKLYPQLANIESLDQLRREVSRLVDLGQGDVTVLDALPPLQPWEFGLGVAMLLENCDLGCHRKQMAALGAQVFLETVFGSWNMLPDDYERRKDCGCKSNHDNA